MTEKLRKIIIDKDGCEIVKLCNVDPTKPIFVKNDGKLIGMVVEESTGWILRLGGTIGSAGRHPTLKALIESCLKYGHEFFTE